MGNGASSTCCLKKLPIAHRPSRIYRQTKIRGSFVVFGRTAVGEASEITGFRITRAMRDHLGKHRQGVGLTIEADESFCH